MKDVSGIYQSKVDTQTIDVLEDLLAKAKTGELRSLMFIDGYRDGTVGSGWAGTPTKSMIGEIEDLKFNYFSMRYFPVEEDGQ